MQHFTTLRPSSTIRFLFFFFIQLRKLRFAMFLFPSYQRQRLTKIERLGNET